MTPDFVITASQNHPFRTFRIEELVLKSSIFLKSGTCYFMITMAIFYANIRVSKWMLFPKRSPHNLGEEAEIM